MKKFLYVAALLLTPVAQADEVINAKLDPIQDIQSFVEKELPRANSDVREMIARETAMVGDCPESLKSEKGLFEHIEDTTEPRNPPFWTHLGKREYAISKIEAEDGKFCYRLVSPAWKALNTDEGRLLATALALTANPPNEEYFRIDDEDKPALNAKVDELFAAIRSKRNTDRLASDFGITSFHSIGNGDERWTTCEGLSSDSEAVRAAQLNSGFIYNTLYNSKKVLLASGTCFWLELPLERGLDAEESMLFEAARLYGVTPPQELLEKDFFHQNREPQNSDDARQPSATPKSDDPITVASTGPLANFDYPNSAIALLMQDGVNIGTAFQLSPNLYVTAAHVVLTNNDEPKSGIRLYPKYRMPSVNNGHRVDVDRVVPYFSIASTLRTSNDYAFLRLNTAVANTSYMSFHYLDTTLDASSALDWYQCATASFHDPYRFHWGPGDVYYNTWWNEYGCQWGGTMKNVVGYPAAVGGVANITNKPYVSTNVGIYGTRGQDGRYYKLVKRCTQCLPVIGITNSNISYGFSGSPLIGLNPYASGMMPTIVGIIAEKVLSDPMLDGLASGYFDYNKHIFDRARTWSPTNLITISSPSEDGSYTSQSVPNLTANAGASTPQLEWRSDLDGLLGYGGNVSVAGKLRPGDHTITASIGSSVTVQSLPSSEDLSLSKRTAGAVIKTVHITITTPPSSTFNITPATVLIPATQSQGKFTYNWSAPAYPSLNLQSSINGGAWAPSPPLAVPASATATDYISVGTNYVFRFMPNNGTNILSTLSVQGVAAPSPVFSANPTTIVTNAASGNSTITWSAPGYAGLDWCGKLDSGPWLCGSLTTAPSGSTVVNVPVGSRYGYRFYPQGSPNQGGAYNLLGELFIQAVGTQQPTFSANPTHVIVPTGGTSGNTVITWSAPTYSGLDWCGRVDGGAWAGGLQTGPVGSTVQPVPVGTTYGYRFYPTGQSGTCGSQNLLGELTVYATH